MAYVIAGPTYTGTISSGSYPATIPVVAPPNVNSSGGNEIVMVIIMAQRVSSPQSCATFSNSPAFAPPTTGFGSWAPSSSGGGAADGEIVMFQKHAATADSSATFNFTASGVTAGSWYISATIFRVVDVHWPFGFAGYSLSSSLGGASSVFPNDYDSGGGSAPADGDTIFGACLLEPQESTTTLLSPNGVGGWTKVQDVGSATNRCGGLGYPAKHVIFWRDKDGPLGFNHFSDDTKFGGVWAAFKCIPETAWIDTTGCLTGSASALNVTGTNHSDRGGPSLSGLTSPVYVQFVMEDTVVSGVAPSVQYTINQRVSTSVWRSDYFLLAPGDRQVVTLPIFDPSIDNFDVLVDAQGGTGTTTTNVSWTVLCTAPAPPASGAGRPYVAIVG